MQRTHYRMLRLFIWILNIILNFFYDTYTTHPFLQRVQHRSLPRQRQAPSLSWRPWMHLTTARGFHCHAVPSPLTRPPAVQCWQLSPESRRPTLHTCRHLSPHGRLHLWQIHDISKFTSSQTYTQCTYHVLHTTPCYLYNACQWLCKRPKACCIRLTRARNLLSYECEHAEFVSTCRNRLKTKLCYVTTATDIVLAKKWHWFAHHLRHYINPF